MPIAGPDLYRITSATVGLQSSSGGGAKTYATLFFELLYFNVTVGDIVRNPGTLYRSTFPVAIDNNAKYFTYQAGYSGMNLNSTEQIRAKFPYGNITYCLNIYLKDCTLSDLVTPATGQCNLNWKLHGARSKMTAET
jgi:hypothetical protein